MADLLQSVGLRGVSKELDKAASKFRELGRVRRQTLEHWTRTGLGVSMGLFGGITIVGSVVLMVLHPSTTTSLVTTSVATILFAYLLTLFGNGLTGQDVLAATMAFAAVLVVSIGTSSPTTTTSSSG